ncbi:MAG: Serine/threonine-protein kinase PknD [Gemmatimonadaceae bacterium]|nr:Serine/threonine-protein kinase PknD [Gemmatimonadaceae bacterium]
MQPTHIGRYTIVGTLGEGGMGTVYEAVQEQPRRTVALKVIRPDYVTPELSRRFARESEVLGRLQHPGIAQVFEAGTADGLYGSQSYFAMELVRGRSLIEHANGKNLSLAQRLDLFARICDAVHYAHQQGVVHRDLKPANILVDSAGQPKILDFGVALLTNADAQATRQTTVGQVVGTLQYMSPEQVNADPALIDGQTDVYSLGVILYELISGRFPYDLSNRMILEAVRVIMVEEPTPLSSIDRGLRGDVEIIVARALEKEKQRRYSSPEELGSDIRRYLRDEPIVARRASAIYQLAKFARRNRSLVTGLALAAAFLVVGSAVSLWLAIRATSAERLAARRRNEAIAAGALAERRRAVADSALLVADSSRRTAVEQRAIAIDNAQRAASEAARQTAVSSFLQDMLAASDPANARGQELSVRELLDQAAGRTSSGSLARQPDVRSAVESVIGRTYYALGLNDLARRHLDTALALRRRLSGSRDLAAAVTTADLGRVAYASGSYADAERQLTQALSILQPLLPHNDDRVTEAIATLASVRQQQGRFPEAERLYRDALDRTRTAHGNDATQVADRLVPLGTFLSFTGRPRDGLPYMEEAVRIVKRHYGVNHPAVVSALLSLSDAQYYLPDAPAAERTLREALPIARALFGTRHPTLADVLNRLGSSLSTQRKFVEAEPLLREALAMRISLLGSDHPDVQLVRVDLARLLSSTNRLPAAESLYTQALASRRATLGDSSPAVASSLMDLGRVRAAQSDWPRAERYFREAIPIWRAAGVTDQELFTSGQLGQALVRQDRLDEAATLANDLVTRGRAYFGPGHWMVGDFHELQARIAIGQHRYAEAESLATLNLDIIRATYGPRSPNMAQQIGNIAVIREMRGDTVSSVARFREALEIVRQRPMTDPLVAGLRRGLAAGLCATGKVAEGDSLARNTMAAIPADSVVSLPWRVRSAVGLCATRAARYAEAEPLLLESEARLAAIGPSVASEREAAMKWLVDLYEAWGRPDEAQRWRSRLRR